jgi:hypothetical protein
LKHLSVNVCYLIVLETFIFLVVSLTLLTTQCFAGKCPKPDVLSPCECIVSHRWETSIGIYCNTKETVDIKKILTKASEDPEVVETWFDDLAISSPITELPEGLTGKLKFRRVRILENEKSLQRINSNAFASSQNTLGDLRISPTNVTNGPAPYSLVDLINSFPILWRLELNSLIDTIQDGTFSVNLTRFTYLQLRVNAIKGSPFAKLENLNIIYLINGSLNHIPSNAFKMEHYTGLLDMLFIDLSGNPLNGSSFQLGAFTHPSLNKRHISLRFEGNNITFLDETVFLPFLQNENNRIDRIVNNPLDCDDCRTAWICKKLPEKMRNKLDDDVRCKDGRLLRDCNANFKKCE